MDVLSWCDVSIDSKLSPGRPPAGWGRMGDATLESLGPWWSGVLVSRSPNDPWRGGLSEVVSLVGSRGDASLLSALWWESPMVGSMRKACPGWRWVGTSLEEGETLDMK